MYCREPMINVYSRDVTRLVRFHEGLGFRDVLGGRLRAGWIADPDGNPIQLVQRGA